MPAEARHERLALLMPEGHRGAARTRFRPRVHLRFLVGQPRERPVNPVAVVEPVSAEDAAHEMRAARGPAFGPGAGAQRDRAVNIAEVEVAPANAPADVPRPVAIADVRRQRRFVQLETAAAIAQR